MNSNLKESSLIMVLSYACKKFEQFSSPKSFQGCYQKFTARRKNKYELIKLVSTKSFSRLTYFISPFSNYVFCNILHYSIQNIFLTKILTKIFK